MSKTMYNGKKCIVCGWFVVGIGVNPPNAHEIASKMVEPYTKWQEYGEYMTKQGEPIYCELCMHGLMGNGLEYIWNGENLLVFDENDEEYHEPPSNVYNPITNHQVQFKFIQNDGRWLAITK